MAPILGFALLLLVFSIGIFLPCFHFFAHKKIPPQEIKKIFLTLISAIFFCAAISQLCLIYSFLISDYSVTNVYQNSHHLKPFIYKISGSWGNHEGSMLLLISVLCAYTLAFSFLSKIELEKKLIIISSQSTIIALFAAFTAFTSNPFARIFPIPKAGLGLNPLLQDIGLSLHPPMLYTGYIGFSLIFSFAIAGLLSENIDKKFAHFLKNWLFFSYGFLTLGIGLGSWWAYRELGWGGFWFWDPVENISLMPWLAATALIHCVKLLERKETFKVWTAFLAILTFILCLIGIFLTRSGVLTSVHSFAIDASRGFFIISLILLIGGAALLIFGAKMNKLKSESEKLSWNSKTTMILINNYFLLIALFITLLGTIYPIFSRGFFDQFISIGPSYYNKVFSILIVPFLVFLAIQNKHSKPRNLLILFTALAFTSLTFFYKTEVDFLQITILFLAIFAAIKTVFPSATQILKPLSLSKGQDDDAETPNSQHRHPELVSGSIRAYRNLTMILAHFGFCLIIIGIVLTTSFGLTREVNLKQNEVLKLGDYEMKFEKIEYFAGKNFIARQGNFLISKNGKALGTLEPQLRFYPISDQTTNETSIRHGVFGDLYVVIGNKDEQENYAIRAYYKPFIYFMWLGCFLIFAAAIRQALKKI